MYLQYLWTNRMKWILKKRREKGCLICKIVNGKEKSFILKKGDIFVVMNKFPYNLGHLLVFPMRHVKNIENLKEEEIKKVFITLRNCIILLKKALKPKGFNIGINIGEVASASISHFHIHIVPRFKRDVGFMEACSLTKVMPERLHETYKKLKRFSYLLEE
ncbi:MAG: HIT domain-containing protein [Candidatus Aenigmatarchaeota archaeon]